MIEYTRVRLSQWGRWCQGGRRTGYPTSSAFVNANTGSRCTGYDSDMPPDIEEVENAVRHLSYALASVVIAVYARKGPIWLKATKIGVSRWTLRRRLGTAERKIEEYLNFDRAAPTMPRYGIVL